MMIDRGKWDACNKMKVLQKYNKKARSNRDMEHSLILQAPSQMCTYTDYGIDGVPSIRDFSVCQN